MLVLERKQTFSASHYYVSDDLSAEALSARFAGGAAPRLHGHNYAIYVSVTGPVDAGTGMVVNIKDVDTAMRRVIVEPFHENCINDTPWFADKLPILENLLLYAWDQLARELEPVRLHRIRIEESRHQAAEYFGPADSMIYVSRTLDFAAAHRLHNPALTDDENAQLFGKCNNPRGHGHNYVIEVTVKGEPDAATGAVCDMYAFEKAIKEHCVDKLDHKYLNEDVPELAGLITSTENLCSVVWSMLKDHIPGTATLHRIRLWETERSCFEYAG